MKEKRDAYNILGKKIPKRIDCLEDLYVDGKIMSYKSSVRISGIDSNAKCQFRFE
jgi:hypothetical protein